MVFTFKAKNGTTVQVPESYLNGFSLDDVGYCLECGWERYQTEPDACNYPCDNEDCGKNQVFGAQEIMMMGLLT